MLEVRTLVEQAEQLGVLYASEDWAPLSDITLGLLLKRANIAWRYLPLHGLAEIVWPPICGVHIMQLEREQTPGEKRLAVRHGLGHVLAGHVAEMQFSRGDQDVFGLEETVADLFALMDLIPSRTVGELLAAGYRGAELDRWLTCELRRYAPNWSEERMRDRVALRLRAV